MTKIAHPIEPEELMAYLDGELSAERATETAAHLGECVECQGIVDGLRGVSQSLKAWEVGKSESVIAQSFATALVERQRERKKSTDGRRTWRDIWRQQPLLAYTGVLAAVLAVVIGSIRFIGGNANSVFSEVAIERPALSSGRPQTTASLQPPSAPASTARSSDKAEVYGLVAAENAPKANGESATTQPKGPMIIRTAELKLTTKDFDKSRAGLEGILKRHRGYVGELKVGGATGSGRTLTATLRVPADQLDATLAELKTLGRVESESQGGQDVTSQYVDLQARLANARNTEKRLTDLLSQRTGKLADVLEVEQEVDRVRGEIEQMEAERKNMTNQVSYATLNVTISEEYKAQLEAVPPSTSTRLSNAAVEGYRSMVDGVVDVILFLLSNGPSWLFWGAVLFLPGRFAWKTMRRWAQ
jgi:hypothetical protein